MFSTLYLHIGQEKTGTTSIQEFLDHNAVRLERNGVFVPRSVGHKNHKALAAHAFEIGSRDIAVTSMRQAETEEEVARYRAGIEAALEREIAASSAPTAVFSSEDLSRLYSAKEVERAVALVRRFTRELKIVVFTRRQDLLASSRYYSLVLGGSRSSQVLPSKGQAAPSYYNYAQNIGLWIDAVGAENVILVRFPETSRAERFNSVKRFCTVLGIKAADYPQVKRQHVSYDAVNQIILQNYNVLKRGYDPKGMSTLMEKLTSTNDPQLNYIPSATQARNFYARFREDNLALFRRLGVEDQLFTEDFSMYGEENMRQTFQAQAIRRLLGLLA